MKEEIFGEDQSAMANSRNENSSSAAAASAAGAETNLNSTSGHGEGRNEKNSRHESVIIGVDKEDDSRRLSMLWDSFKARKSICGNNLALFEEPSEPFISSYLKGYTTPGPLEREKSKRAKAELGVMLGVYLPTIQHILGVTMFIRLFWMVGIAGIAQTFVLLFICCICTFLTSISLSAIATNGVVESGGAYFMISRNLGPEFGSAVGILFYLANTVATAMYLVGGVEILLLYIFPGLTIGGTDVHSDTGVMGWMSHNLRFYATILLLLEFVIVAMGVSLFCVILSIFACYAGGIEKTITSDAQQYHTCEFSVCMLGEHLLQARVVLPGDAPLSEICNYCNASVPGPLLNYFCPNGECSEMFVNNELRCINGFPGFASSAFIDNLGPNYVGKDEYLPGKPADRNVEVFQDVQTTFFVLLAIYFPAVTGILTGANMSGDLKGPNFSIPAGTIAAQLTTSFIYFSLALVFGATIDGAVLRDKYGQSLRGGMIVANLAWPTEWLLLVGSFLSTFGAALQCLCSAPRLLQSIAKDDVIPILKPFAKVTSKNEPFKGLLITTIIVELSILMGAMDQIAAVVDFFFLMCYAFVNLICALHSLLGAPNWRPRFKFYHWSLALLGAGLCFFIMFSTHWDYAIVSCVLCLAIYKYVEWKGAKKEWGDGIRGLALTTAQYSLMKINEKDPHPKNFRPQLLLLLSMPWSKELVDMRYLNLINLASQLKASRGLTIVVAFIRGNPLIIDDRKKAEEVKERVEFDMNQIRLRGFAKTLVYGETQIGGSVSTLIQSVGMGGLRPNTLLLSWPVHTHGASCEAMDSEYHTFTDKLHVGVATDMCLVVAKDIVNFPVSAIRLSGTIDVYWIVQDGGLCLLIAYLLTQSKVWRGCKLRVIAIAQEMDNNTKLQADLQKYVYQLRIDARIMVIELSDPKISKNAFERTLLMEERTRYTYEMWEIKRNLNKASPLVTPEMKHNSKLNSDDNDTDTETKGKTDDKTGDDDNEETPTSSKERERVSSMKKAISLDKTHSNHDEKRVTIAESKNEIVGGDDNDDRDKKFRMLDKKKVRKMHTAVRLNELILANSADSQLVLLNLPKPPVAKEGLDDYMHYLEVLSDKIPRILFIRGTGKEVITTYS
uniref:Solute carrier family 12 member 6 n=1 Tax=Elaeophora elaphi TaxID=1147741 RepID=A0A0R3S2I3_9BILA